MKNTIRRIASLVATVSFLSANPRMSYADVLVGLDFGQEGGYIQYSEGGNQVGVDITDCLIPRHELELKEDFSDDGSLIISLDGKTIPVIKNIKTPNNHHPFRVVITYNAKGQPLSYNDGDYVFVFSHLMNCANFDYATFNPVLKEEEQYYKRALGFIKQLSK